MSIKQATVHASITHKTTSVNKVTGLLTVCSP